MASKETIFNCPRCNSEHRIEDDGKGVIRFSCECGCYCSVQNSKISEIIIVPHSIGEVVLESSSHEKKVALWNMVAKDAICGKCGEKTLLKGPRGGLSINLICDSCGQRFWISVMPSFGAYFL